MKNIAFIIILLLMASCLFSDNFIICDIVYPYYKQAVQSKDPNKTFKCSVVIEREDFSFYGIEYSLKSDAKTLKRGMVSVRPNKKQDITFGLEELKPGKYSCEFVVKNRDKVLDKYKYSFEVYEPVDFEVTFDEKHLCYLNGEPFFPIGLYHANQEDVIRHNPDKQFPSEDESIEDIKDKNFNIAIALNYIQGFSLKPEEYPVYAKYDLVFCPEVNRIKDKTVLDTIIKTVNEQNISLFYYTYDEAHEDNIKDAIEAYDYINQKDIHRPVVAAIDRWGDYVLSNKAFDIFLPDHYIFTQNNYPSVATLKGQIDAAKTGCKGKKPVWFCLQAFGWGDTEMEWRVPTREELRCQAYFCIVNGVTGLLWYGYMTGEPDKTSPYGMWFIKTSDLWDYFKVLNKEILDFSQILYKGKSIGSLKCDNELIYSNVWQAGDKKYAIIVNPEQTKQTGVFEDLPENVKPYFDYSYNIEGRKINFKPLECVIIEY